MAYLRGRGEWFTNREKRFSNAPTAAASANRPQSSATTTYVRHKRFSDNTETLDTYQPLVVENAPGGYVVREYDTYSKNKSKSSRTKGVYLKSETYYDNNDNPIKVKRWRNDDGRIEMQLERNYQTGQRAYYSRAPEATPAMRSAPPATYEEARRLQLAQQQRQRFTDRPTMTEYRGQVYRAGTREYFEGKEATRRFQEYSALSQQGARVGDLAPAPLTPRMTRHGGFSTAFAPREESLMVSTDVTQKTVSEKPGFLYSGYAQTFFTREEGFSGRLPVGGGRSVIHEKLSGQAAPALLGFYPGQYGEYSIRKTDSSERKIFSSVFDNWNREEAARMGKSTWKTNFMDKLWVTGSEKVEKFSARVVERTPNTRGFNPLQVVRFSYGAVGRLSRYSREKPVSFASSMIGLRAGFTNKITFGTAVGLGSASIWTQGRRGMMPREYQQFLAKPETEKIIQSDYAGKDIGAAFWRPAHITRVKDWFTLKGYRGNVEKGLRQQGYAETEIPSLTEAILYEKRTRQGIAPAMIGGEITGNLWGAEAVRFAGRHLGRFAWYQNLRPSLRSATKYGVGTGIGGVGEGIVASVSLDVMSGRRVSARRAAKAASVGFLTAGGLGAVYGYGITTKGWKGHLARGVVYPWDQPAEEAGDIVTGLLMRGRHTRTPVMTMTPAATKNKVIDVTFSEVVTGRAQPRSNARALAPVRSQSFGFVRARTNIMQEFVLAKNNAQTSAPFRGLVLTPARSATRTPLSVMIPNNIFTHTPTRSPTRSLVSVFSRQNINTRINTRIDTRAETDVPVFVPTGKGLAPFLFGSWPMAGRRRKSKRKYQYAPELSSLFFGIRAKKTPRTPRGGWTGFEIRPVVT